MTIDKNDPRLTAFALGELPSEEAAELQAALKKDPTLQAEVDAIRKLADKLKTTLAEEPLPMTEPARPLEPVKKSSRFRRRLVFYGSGVAAVVVVLVVLIAPAMQPARDGSGRIAMQNSTDAQHAGSESGHGQKKKHELFVQDKLAELVEQFNQKMEEQSYAEAEIIAKRAVELAPDNVTSRQLMLNAKFIRRYSNNQSLIASKEHGFLEKLESVDESSIRPATPPPNQPQTGKLMFGVGVDSEAGMVGSLLPTNSPSTPPAAGGPGVTTGGRVSLGYTPLKKNRTGMSGAYNESLHGRRSSVVGMSAPGVFSADLMTDIAGRIEPGGTREITLRDSYRHRTGPHNTEAYDKIIENEFKRVAEHPLSTFSIDVDTASYSMVRKMLTQGRMPVPGAVRLEELINYFDYAYQPPTDGKPFATHVDAARCPWNEKHNLVRIGLKGRVIDKKERDPANLVFLLDVSGSMRPANKLPLLKDGMKMLVENLNAKDRVAIVVYAGASGLVLPSTECSDKQKILESLDRLQSGGSTNGGAGIQLAYATAAANYIEGGVNRVILCTDGDFNVGTTNQSELVATIEKKAKEGVFLTVLGFGMGNYKDSTLEKLADKGNGNYGYVDTINEAKKLLVEGLSGTLVTIAKDVKIQVEFNPQHVKSYRLLGYENRMLRKEDFNDDTKDAGEIGAGHTVTALYEIIPADSAEKIAKPTVDELKYQKPVEATEAADSEEMLTVKLRYKEPHGQKSKLLEFPVKNQIVEFDAANVDLRFASSVAAFGMILRGSEFKGDADYNKVIAWAKSSLGEDEFDYRQEFLKLVRVAKSLSNK